MRVSDWLKLIVNQEGAAKRGGVSPSPRLQVFPLSHFFSSQRKADPGCLEEPF